MPSALCYAGTKSIHGGAATEAAVPLAVGFHLGQSYATSAAQFSNGSIIGLAKVPASSEYTALMERMVQEPAPQDRFGSLSILSRLLSRVLGAAPSRDTAILAKMVAALKAESETALDGYVIGTAAVTAPWMAAWDGQIAFDSIINDVLVVVGMEPVTWEGTDPIYLGEINSLLAANKRQLCLDRWCCGDMGPREQGAIAFLISFTNQSLHTSFQLASCFYYNSWDNHLASIDSRYGLDSLEDSKNPQDFWGSVRKHLIEAVEEHTRRKTGFSYLPFIVLVAGEAATHSGFTRVLQEVVESIPDIRIANSGEETNDNLRQEGAELRPNLELIVSDRPTFAAAEGAAFWMWMRLDGSYCDDWDAAHPGECVSQYEMLHAEL